MKTLEKIKAILSSIEVSLVSSFIPRPHIGFRIHYSYILHLFRTLNRKNVNFFMFFYSLFSVLVLGITFFSIVTGEAGFGSYFNFILYTITLPLNLLQYSIMKPVYFNYELSMFLKKRKLNYKVRFARFRHFKKFLIENNHLYALEYITRKKDGYSIKTKLLVKKEYLMHLKKNGLKLSQEEYDKNFIDSFNCLIVIDETLWVMGWDTEKAIDYINEFEYTSVSEMLEALHEEENISSSFVNIDGDAVIISLE